MEALIKKYFSGGDMYFVTRYLSAKRQYNPKEADEAKLIRQLLNTKPEAPKPAVNLCTYATMDDASALAGLYRSVFPVYPTPVKEPEYLKKTMLEGTVYVVIREGGRLVSAASAEINRKYHNAELTDCATSAEGQGRGHMQALLAELEKHLKAEGITCLYTIARSESFAMNKVFYQLGYTYGGRMTNNCMIYSGLEDMNVWYKY
jgi:beta-lysine N6-acetyltransferase